MDMEWWRMHLICIEWCSFCFLLSFPLNSLDLPLVWTDTYSSHWILVWIGKIHLHSSFKKKIAINGWIMITNPPSTCKTHTTFSDFIVSIHSYGAISFDWQKFYVYKCSNINNNNNKGCSTNFVMIIDEAVCVFDCINALYGLRWSMKLAMPTRHYPFLVKRNMIGICPVSFELDRF